eukprot:4230086-Pleurochrysis_carterae.AAC.3
MERKAADERAFALILRVPREYTRLRKPRLVAWPSGGHGGLAPAFGREAGGDAGREDGDAAELAQCDRGPAPRAKREAVRRPSMGQQQKGKEQGGRGGGAEKQRQTASSRMPDWGFRVVGSGWLEGTVGRIVRVRSIQPEAARPATNRNLSENECVKAIWPALVKVGLWRDQ